MIVMKIRRVGNSNVVSIPRELEGSGYTPGSSVILERTPTGELLLIPESRLRARVRSIGRRAIEENREALRMLEEYDRGDIPAE